LYNFSISSQPSDQFLTHNCSYNLHCFFTFCTNSACTIAY